MHTETTYITWKGIEYDSLETCTIKQARYNVEVKSLVVGMYRHVDYEVNYTLELSNAWQIHHGMIYTTINRRRNAIELSRQSGKWFMNQEYQEEWKNCADIDIPLTPLTNSLPINRLQLKPGQQHDVEVVYIDLLAGVIKPVRQRYIRLNDRQYHYENIPNDFEATITVDVQGIVCDYPQLFTRTL